MQKAKNYAGIIHQDVTLFIKPSNYQITIRIKVTLKVKISNTMSFITWVHLTWLTPLEPLKVELFKWIKISNVKSPLVSLYFLTQIIACT